MPLGQESDHSITAVINDRRKKDKVMPSVTQILLVRLSGCSNYNSAARCKLGWAKPERVSK